MSTPSSHESEHEQFHRSEWQNLGSARQLLYQYFSLATCDPRSRRWQRLSDPGFLDAIQEASEFVANDLRMTQVTLAPGEKNPENLTTEPMRPFVTKEAVLSEEHDQIFGLVMSADCPPYETEYYPQTFSVSRSHHLADIAGFYKAFGVEPSDDHRERPDHISLELEFMGWLVAKEAHAATLGEGSEEFLQLSREAQKSFFTDHLSWWIPAFANALAKKSTPGSFHEALADALAAFIAAERAVLEVQPPTMLCGDSV